MQFNFIQDLNLANQYLNQLDNLPAQFSEQQKNEKVEALKGRIDQCMQKVKEKADPSFRKEVDTLEKTWDELKENLKDVPSLTTIQIQHLKTFLQNSISGIRQRIFEIQDQDPIKEGKQEVEKKPAKASKKRIFEIQDQDPIKEGKQEVEKKPAKASKKEGKQEVEEKPAKVFKGPAYLPSRELKQFIEFTKTSPEGLKWLQDKKPETVKIWISVLEHLKEGQYGTNLKQAAQEFDPSMTLQQNMLALMLYELAADPSSPVPECFKPYQNQHPEDFKQLLKDLSVYRTHNSLNFVESLFNQNKCSLTENEESLRKRIFSVSSGVKVGPKVTEPLLKPVEFADLSRLFSSIMSKTLPPDRNSVNYLIDQKAFERAASLAASIPSPDAKLAAFKDIVINIYSKNKTIVKHLADKLDNIQDFSVLKNLKDWAKGNKALEIVDFIDNTSAMKFIVAVEKKDVNQVIELLKSNKVDPAADNNKAICFACENGHIELARLLLETGKVDPAANNNEAIRHACINGHVDIVKLLLETGQVDPAANNNEAIRHAFTNGHVEIVNLLLNNVQDFKILKWLKVLAENYNYPKIVTLITNTPTMKFLEAVEEKDINQAIKLLKSGKVDPAADNNKAIRFACENGHIELARLLLETGKVDPTVNDNEAIGNASKKGHIEIVKLLLEIGKVNPSADNNKAIRYACFYGHIELVRLLLETGKVDPAVNDNEPILFACQSKNSDIVKLLLESGKVNPAAKNNRAIRFACQEGLVKIAQLLLETGKVNPSADDDAAIRFACAYGYIEIVKLLLKDDKVNPAVVDNAAIRLACANGHIEIVKLLLENDKVDPTARNNYALQEAIKKGYEEIKNLLLKKEKVRALALSQGLI